MATIPLVEYRQGILDVANPLVFTAPNKYQSLIAFSFNNPAAYDITVNMTRRMPSSTVQLYSLTLDPGDTIQMSGYMLMQQDSIEIVTGTPNTTYTLSINNIPQP